MTANIGLGLGALLGSVTGPGEVVTPISTAQIALGEVGWALVRGTAYSSAFFLVMVVMGLVHSAWGLLDVPVTILIGFAFAALGMAVTSTSRPAGESPGSPRPCR